MKTRKILSACLLLMAAIAGHAQPDTAKISRNALSFADSLVKTDAFGNWSSYADLAPLSVIKYYGGKDGYIQHVVTIRNKTNSDIEEAAPELKMVTLEPRKDQWQCVISLSRYFHKEDKQYHFVSYLIGQSKDEGENWKLFDVSYTPVSNLIYIFPEILDDIAIKNPAIEPSAK
jgi:hypothetical protein